MNAAELKPHALASIVPGMSPDEYADLIADIEANGLRAAHHAVRGAGPRRAASVTRLR